MESGGLFGPTWDDVFRIAILVVGLVNVAVIIAGILTMRHYARLLLDVEQFTREVRNYAREGGPPSPELTSERSSP
jgi:Na+(H+)/acetate symporter ActP